MPFLWRVKSRPEWADPAGGRLFALAEPCPAFAGQNSLGRALGLKATAPRGGHAVLWRADGCADFHALGEQHKNPRRKDVDFLVPTARTGVATSFCGALPSFNKRINFSKERARSVFLKSGAYTPNLRMARTMIQIMSGKGCPFPKYSTAAARSPHSRMRSSLRR